MHILASEQLSFIFLRKLGILPLLPFEEQPFHVNPYAMKSRKIKTLIMVEKVFSLLENSWKINSDEVFKFMMKRLEL